MKKVVITVLFCYAGVSSVCGQRFSQEAMDAATRRMNALSEMGVQAVFFEDALKAAVPDTTTDSTSKRAVYQRFLNHIDSSLQVVRQMIPLPYDDSLRSSFIIYFESVRYSLLMFSSKELELVIQMMTLFRQGNSEAARPLLTEFNRVMDADQLHSSIPLQRRYIVHQRAFVERYDLTMMYEYGPR